MTENTQPAILTTSIAVSTVMQDLGWSPDVVAGHSLGEYSALVVAGSLSFEDAVRVVRLRGRFMQQAVPAGEGAMAAVIGLSLQQLNKVCQEAAQSQVVTVANINSSSQIVVAGHRQAVERASQLARQKGARRVVALAVSAPFHSPLMEPAREQLAKVLEDVDFRDLAHPLVNNVEARTVLKGEVARSGLIRQVTAPVRWMQCVEQMGIMGVRSFVEVGPGRVLTGLIRRIDRGAEAAAVGKVEHLQSYA